MCATGARQIDRKRIVRQRNEKVRRFLAKSLVLTDNDVVEAWSFIEVRAAFLYLLNTPDPQPVFLKSHYKACVFMIFYFISHAFIYR